MANFIILYVNRMVNNIRPIEAKSSAPINRLNLILLTQNEGLMASGGRLFAKIQNAYDKMAKTLRDAISIKIGAIRISKADFKLLLVWVDSNLSAGHETIKSVKKSF